VASSELTWHPAPLPAGRPAYQALADVIATDIAGLRLRAGDRLPTHRALARALGVTVGTVARGYAEAERRGLLSGEVGRGTFVRAAFGLSGGSGPGLADLAHLHPPGGPGLDTAALLAETLRAVATDPVAVRRAVDTEDGDAPAHRAAAAAYVAHGDLRPAAEQVILTAGAQHALTACLAALAGPGAPVATAVLTNPGLLAAARTLGHPVVAVAADADGMLPDALADVLRDGSVRVVHVQPTLHNPTARTMPAARRAALAGACQAAGAWLIEEDPLGPLAATRPEALATLAPATTCHIASAAKVLAPGLRVGVLTVPAAAVGRLAGAVRATAWLAAPLLAEVLTRWVGDGTARAVADARRAAATARHGDALARLAAHPPTGAADAPMLWLALPEPWTAATFTRAARGAGVLVSAGAEYAAARTAEAEAVRVGLNAGVDDTRLHAALDALATLLADGPPVEDLA
jgi:DNA-binding transcriptional MocR family regulator